MTGSGDDPGAEEDERDVSDAALARGMRSDADDNTYFAAWREFDHRHLAHIKGFIEGRAPDVGAGKGNDLLSETLRRIQEGIDQYVDRGPGKLRSWCIKIADRVIKDYWRGRLTRIQDGPPNATQLVSFDEIEELYGAGLVANDAEDYPALAVPSGDETPRPLSERALVLWDAFESLNEIDQAVIWCKMVQSDSDAYVAEITGKPVDHVRKIRDKAVKKLVKRFDHLMAARRQAS